MQRSLLKLNKKSGEFEEDWNLPKIQHARPVYTNPEEPEIEQGYFGCYSHFSIHEEMLRDRVRSLTYLDAFLANKSIFQGKTVMDVGCGTGILSIFATRAGCQSVLAVDNAEVAEYAKVICKDHGAIKVEKSRV